MTGVRHEEDEIVYTAPDLGDVAHHAGAPDIDASQVNAFLQKIFDIAGLTADDVKHKSSSMEAEELTEILSSVTAGIYFKHIASIKTARDSLIASLRLVQRIRAAVCSIEDGKALPPHLMWKTLMNEQHLIPKAYQVTQSGYSEEMYFVLLMRFEMFIDLKLADSSDEVLDEWSKAPETKFTKNYQQKNFANAMYDLMNFTPDVTTPAPAPAPAPAPRAAPPSDLTAMWGQLPPTPTTQSRKRARSVDISHSDTDLDNETQSETPNDSAGASNNNREHRDNTGAGLQHDEKSLTLMLEKMKANPSEHHQKWLGRSAMFRPDREEEQLMAKITASKVQGTKASFLLTTSDDREWWVDNITAAGSILHVILFVIYDHGSGLKP
jgi:hypothetical protein